MTVDAGSRLTLDIYQSREPFASMNAGSVSTDELLSMPLETGESMSAELLDERPANGWRMPLAAFSAILAGDLFQAACLSAALHSISLVLIGVASIAVPGHVPPLRIEAVLEDEAPLEVEALELPAMPIELVRAEKELPQIAAAGSGGGQFAPGLIGAGGTVIEVGESPEAAAPFTGTGSVGTGGAGGLSLQGAGLLKEFREVQTEASFFGVKATGRRFAFVVDTSGSMGGENRWLRARTELLRSLKALGYGQDFYVVFFNDRTFPMPAGKMQAARPSTVTQVSHWIHRAIPSGSTEPWPALQLALDQKPDAVFLLTDGLFDPIVVEHVQRLKTGDRTPIHTIGFAINTAPLEMQTQIEEQLTTIARSTGGTYRFVPLH